MIEKLQEIAPSSVEYKVILDVELIEVLSYRTIRRIYYLVTFRDNSVKAFRTTNEIDDYTFEEQSINENFTVLDKIKHVLEDLGKLSDFIVLPKKTNHKLPKYLNFNLNYCDNDFLNFLQNQFLSDIEGYQKNDFSPEELDRVNYWVSKLQLGS